MIIQRGAYRRRFKSAAAHLARGVHVSVVQAAGVRDLHEHMVP